jgi:hypothetical protein
VATPDAPLTDARLSAALAIATTEYIELITPTFSQKNIID